MGKRLGKIRLARRPHLENSASKKKLFHLGATPGNPIPKRADGKTPLLGVHQGLAVYLLFNGVLGDRRPAGGNVLTHEVAHFLPEHPGATGLTVVYGEACRLGMKSLARYGIRFRQIPFELKVD